MSVRCLVLIGWATVVAVCSVRAQPADSVSHVGNAGAMSHASHEMDERVDAFIKRVRSATRRYQELDEAILAGYRLLGPDFPGMGEHWVDVHRAIHSEVDLVRPAVLTYVPIGDERVLTGVAYTHPVRPGEEPVEIDLPAHWHFHSGTVDEEMLLLNPHSMGNGGEDQPRLGMLHAWIWIDNPAGIFEQDNWALPFVRLGLPAPDSIPPQAGKALFVLTDGVEYYRRLVEIAGRPNEADEAAVETALISFHDHVQSRYEAIQAEGTVSDSDVSWLVTSWHQLWMQIRGAVTPELWTRIEMLSG